jgi:hypothetical protein
MWSRATVNTDIIIFVATDMRPASSMNAAARNEELCGASAGQTFSQKLSLGPLASDIFPKPEHSSAAPFSRPGSEVLSEAIPVFFIGRNRDGFWVARDAEGKFGGLFWRKQAALRFARRSAGPVGCATVFPHGRLELDIENTGNPLVTQIAAIKRLVTHAASELIVALRKAGYSQANWDVEAAKVLQGSREAKMRRLFRAALAIVLIAVALTGIIALKTAIYLPRLHG